MSLEATVRTFLSLPLPARVRVEAIRSALGDHATETTGYAAHIHEVTVSDLTVDTKIVVLDALTPRMTLVPNFTETTPEPEADPLMTLEGFLATHPEYGTIAAGGAIVHARNAAHRYGAPFADCDADGAPMAFHTTAETWAHVLREGKHRAS